MPDAVGALAETDDHIYPGTYTPLFQPPLTFTVAHEVDLSCAPGFRCRGDIEVNQPGWLGLGFGNAPSFEVTINRLDKVIDPNRKGAMVDPPKELPDWIAKLPGITLVAPPKHIEIGGLDAVQLDIRTSDKGVTFGPIPPPGAPFDFGFGPHDSHRIIAVNVAGHAVLIVIGVVRDSPGTVVTPAQLQPAIDALQPLVDSIVWQ